MEDAEGIRRLARVRVDTLIWLVFAIVLFLVSAWLTHLITKIEQKGGQSRLAVTFLGADVHHFPILTFEAEGKKLGVSIANIDSNISTVRLGAFYTPEQKEVTCNTSDREMSTSWQAATHDEFPESYLIPGTDVNAPLSLVLHLGPHALLPQFATKIKKTIFDKSGLPKLDLTIPSNTSVKCSLPPSLTDDTFTSRALDITVSEGLFAPAGSDPRDAYLTSPKQEIVSPDQVSLHDDDAQEIHVTNVGTGETLLASSITAPFAVQQTRAQHRAVTEHFAWESKTATSRRDILITVIGSLIALGAAALIEACRPYIEKLVRAGPKP